MISALSRHLTILWRWNEKGENKMGVKRRKPESQNRDRQPGLQSKHDSTWSERSAASLLPARKKKRRLNGTLEWLHYSVPPFLTLWLSAEQISKGSELITWRSELTWSRLYLYNMKVVLKTTRMTSTDNTVPRLLEKHFPQRIPLTERKLQPRKRYVVCY